jgi:Uma2 family endonuclease
METIVLRDRVTNQMTDEEFFWFCLENKDLRIERNHTLEITIMSPVTSLSGFWNMEISRQLANWAIDNDTGYVFDSSTGFTLPDKSILSPDAAWISKVRWKKIGFEDQNRFAPICPEFVIELRSKSDDIEYLKNKMEVWMRNGTQLAWLIDPFEKRVVVFATAEPRQQIIDGFGRKIIGIPPVKGFELDLSRITY